MGEGICEMEQFLCVWEEDCHKRTSGGKFTSTTSKSGEKAKTEIERHG